MKAVLLRSFGDENVMYIGDAPRPALGAHDVRIRVRATAVNRADLLQREGHYPPPPGASEIIGLECAGEVLEVGAEVRGFAPGERVMALLPGGGYAEEVVVDAGSVMHMPESLSFEEAAAIPEVFLTAYLTLFMLAGVQRGERALVHGGGSGIGTASISMLKLAGVTVLVTAGSDEKCARCIAHGADVAINYRTEDWVARAKGVNVILDHIGARYLPKDIEALALDGRVVLIGGMGGGTTAEISVEMILGKRLRVIGSTLRNRPKEFKAEIVRSFVERFGPDLASGRLRPVVHRVFALEDVAEAHRLMKASDHFGKIVLRVP